MKDIVKKAISILKKQGYKVYPYSVTENIAHLAPKTIQFFDIEDKNGKVVAKQAIASTSENDPIVAFAEWWGNKVLYVNTQTKEISLR